MFFKRIEYETNKRYLFDHGGSLFLASCNSEDLDYKIDYTAIHPIGGQYKVKVFDGTTNVVTACNISNNTDNLSDKCWVRIGSYSSTAAYAINGKLDCNVSSLTFSGTEIMNLAGNVETSTAKFTLKEGKILLMAAKAPSGAKADSIHFTYTSTKKPGITYVVAGYRYTGWVED